MSILKRPLVTEKSASLKEHDSYVCEVDINANKNQIRTEIESRFKVNVLKIRTVRIPGKYRRRIGPVGGYRSDWKKAIVKVKPGQQIKWEEIA